MLKLDQDQINQKIDFIENYVSASNAATGSQFDANANVSSKNIATLESELNKDINIQVNRSLMSKRLSELFDDEIANEYLRQIKKHEIYVHDETSLKPYCVSISMYPFLLRGLETLGGESGAPRHLESFAGSFVNLVFAISSQFAGAVATVEFLMYLDYFARKDFGEDYLVEHKREFEGVLKHVVYSINQPAAARGYQAVFWNISLYDENYFNSMFESFVFPDLSKPDWKSLDRLQKYFMKWFNVERQRAVLTFPVVTAAMLVDKKGPLDADFADFCAEELSEGNSFFVYQSESADSLASCCRLRSEISDNTFSYSLGAGGVSTGSINVITINMNRLVQDNRALATEVKKIHKYQIAYRSLINDFRESGMLPVYDAGYISLDKQFLTIGINGMVEAAESRGIKPGNNEQYIEFVRSNLKVIYDENKAAKTKYGYMFNTEFVPAENLGVKNADWDKKDGYKVERNCYNSYFYPVEDDDINVIDKFALHGSKINKYLDGGSALHLNLQEHLTKKNYLKLLEISAKSGCNYFCTNVLVTICNECGFIDKETRESCFGCDSEDIDYGTRVIGYLKRVTSFSSRRQKEHTLRHYHRESKKQNSRVVPSVSSAEIQAGT
jgi:ribonucleoside-triphosphate reductase (formate)